MNDRTYFYLVYFQYLLLCCKYKIHKSHYNRTERLIENESDSIIQINKPFIYNQKRSSEILTFQQQFLLRILIRKKQLTIRYHFIIYEVLGNTI